MKRLIKKYRNLKNEDRGAALLLVGLSLSVLMGMAAFGSDLAWFYLNTSRIQRAADAAALGGVVWLPNNETTALATAHAIAIQNGYTHDAINETTRVVPVRVPDELNQLEVTVSDTVPTFFLRIFGMHRQVITRSAVAEYIPPLKLGSPSNKFGNDPECYAANVDCRGNFWLNIHGTRTTTSYGDAFSSFCSIGSSGNGCGQNPTYRPHGYLFGIDPRGAASVRLEQLDITYHHDAAGVAQGDPHRTGDHDAHQAGTIPGQSVTVNVYFPDPTPMDISDNTLYCSHTFTPLPQINPDDNPPFNYPANWDALGKGWATVCGDTINTSSSPNGIWVVQVVANTGASAGVTMGTGPRTTNSGNTGISGINQSGLNRFSLRTNVGNLFALGDFSIYNNAAGTITSFHLAEVPDFYRGKTLVIELYDAGESSVTGTLAPVAPGGGSYTGGCRIYTASHSGDLTWSAPTTINPGSICQRSVAPNEFDGRWLKFEIDLPPTYACTDCWWKMNYDYPGDMNDTTTWRAYILGNPIHLLR